MVMMMMMMMMMTKNVMKKEILFKFAVQILS